MTLSVRPSWEGRPELTSGTDPALHSISTWLCSSPLVYVYTPEEIFFKKLFLCRRELCKKATCLHLDGSENCIKKSDSDCYNHTLLALRNPHILAHPWPTKSLAPPLLLSFLSHYIPLCFFALKPTGPFQFLKGDRLCLSQDFSQCMPSACYHFPH